MSVPVRIPLAAPSALALMLFAGSCASTAGGPTSGALEPGAAGAATPGGPAPGPRGSGPRGSGQAQRALDFEGTLSIAYDNDVFAGNDNRYSSGLAVAWVTTDVAELSGGNWLRRFGEGASFLPGVGSEGRATHVGFQFGQEIYTPEGLLATTPPPGEHPYAGVLALDTSIFTKGERSLHAYTLRLGVVGPSALGKQLQRNTHAFVKGVPPQGWESQLSDEPIINLDYAGYWRLARGVRGRSLGSDLTLRGGAGAGTYYVGADAGLTGRLGWGIPDTYGFSETSRSQHALVGYRPERGVRTWFFVDLGSQAVGRFLPTDGLAFQDSPSGDRASLFWTGTGGAAIGWGRLRLTFSYKAIVGSGDVGNGHQRQDDFGSLRLSWSF